MLAHAADERTRRLIRRERDFVELAFYRGEMPAESVLLYEGLNEAGLARSLGAWTTGSHVRNISATVASA